jgi:hypothetical protein
MKDDKTQAIEEIIGIGRERGRSVERAVHDFLASQPPRAEAVRFFKQRCVNELFGARLFTSLVARLCTRIDHDLIELMSGQARDELRHHSYAYRALTELGESLEGFAPHPMIVDYFNRLLASSEHLDPVFVFASVQSTGELEGLYSLLPISDLLQGTEYDPISQAHAKIIVDEERHTEIGRIGMERYGNAESLGQAREFILSEVPPLHYDKLLGTAA